MRSSVLCVLPGAGCKSFGVFLKRELIVGVHRRQQGLAHQSISHKTPHRFRGRALISDDALGTTDRETTSDAFWTSARNRLSLRLTASASCFID